MHEARVQWVSMHVSSIWRMHGGLFYSVPVMIIPSDFYEKIVPAVFSSAVHVFEPGIWRSCSAAPQSQGAVLVSRLNSWMPCSRSPFIYGYETTRLLSIPPIFWLVLGKVELTFLVTRKQDQAGCDRYTPVIKILETLTLLEHITLGERS